MREETVKSQAAKPPAASAGTSRTAGIAVRAPWPDAGFTVPLQPAGTSNVNTPSALDVAE